MAKKRKDHDGPASADAGVDGGPKPKMKRKEYEAELEVLQGELVALQEWVKATGAKIIIVFEGRDTAGKGGTIKRITERVSPRTFRVVALPAPTDREKSQMYIQRYITHFPAAGEVVIFDRSWYNRAGVEPVMGFCTPKQTDDFLRVVPSVERAMVDSGIHLVKYWLDVSAEEQTRRLESRMHDPRKIWKLSDMDLLSYSKWYDYSRARDRMLASTDSAWAPWFVTNTDDKKRARLNIISHFLSQIPYEPLERREVTPAEAAAPGQLSRSAPRATPHPGEVLTPDMTATQGTTDAPVNWYSLSADDTAARLDVDPAVGLSSAEAARRLEQHGPNRMAAKQQESGLHAFLRQYQDFMQILLLGAAIVNIVVTGDWGTTIVLIGLTVFNAVLSLRGEAKAAASVGALEKMLKNIARVRRDGEAIEIDSEGLVPGDIVLMEAGNRVPADGRLLLAATLEIEEGALTGESVPVLKDSSSIDATDVGIGDRHCLAFMNTAVTRGRGEMIVTTTGMGTEIGHIADMLNETEAERTPLQKQLDRLTIVIACIAGLAFLIMLLIGISNDDDFDVIFTAGIALAIAAIPCGLPAVVTTMYSAGTRALADLGAIVKRLPSVETLGSVSAVCSDKTGTLTLNKMTAREFSIPGQHRFKVTGEGYDTTGTFLSDGGAPVDLESVLMPMALCADARLDDDGELIGDPTEGALIVLAAKGGLHLDGVRARYPRVAEVPFDSDYKFMATFHEMTDEQQRPVVRCFVKGAPDVLIGRGGWYLLPDGELRPITDDNRRLALDENDRIAGQGERVMVVARRDFDPTTFDASSNLIDLVQDLTLLAMVGIVDPPRAEAKAAIAECKKAGIQVRMITGDHAVTAAAIGRELGIDGEALTGAEFAAMSDDELAARLPAIAVVARVAPDDKVRLVQSLQRLGNIVSMTGDGVNDAPALKKADIGVAMGITGTEVSKEAAIMILTDDNFATIIKAVKFGRELYVNLSKFIRFQMVGLVSFIASFLGAAIFSISGGIPFTPAVVLYINFLIQVPMAIALGFDQPLAGVMERPPRPMSAPVLSRAQWIRIVIMGLVVAATTLVILDWAESELGILTAGTMALTVFGLLLMAVALGARSEFGTVFDRHVVGGRRQLMLFGVSLMMIVLASELGVLQRALDTASLTGGQWLVCIGAGVALVLVDEAIKLVLRSRQRQVVVAS